MNIKENYFRQRNLSLKKENRVIAAKREIDTINFILKEFFQFNLIICQLPNAIKTRIKKIVKTENKSLCFKN